MKVFISHASEDKDSFVRPLASALRERRLDVWYDEYELRIGDSLREKIDEGLAACDYGIVVLSEAFFAKRWPQQELNGLFSRAMSSDRRFLLPIRHSYSIEQLRQQSPMLADRISLSTADGLTPIIEHLMSVGIGDEAHFRHEGRVLSTFSYAHRYYNPPADIPTFGYHLRAGSYSELVSQLRPREVIIAYARPYGTHEAAGHITCQERMLEFERDYEIAPDYYAVDVRKILHGFNQPLSPNELRELLGHAPSNDNSRNG